MDTAQVLNTGINEIDRDNSGFNVYPNPATQSTTIRYTITVKDFVDISIYNLCGQKVKSFVSTKQSAGDYSVNWNTDTDNGQKVSEGIYFCRINIAGQVKEAKIIVL